MACWRNRHLGDCKDADRCRHVIAGPVRAADQITENDRRKGI
jgi:hypothetical protein